MNRVLLCVMMSATLAMTGCTIVSPDPGQAAVLIDKPIIFGDGGVRIDDVRPAGLSYTWWTTEKTYVDITPQTTQVAFDDFSSQDNILLDFQTQIQYKITQPGILLAKFGPDWFKNNVASQYSSIVRDQVKRYAMSQMMSDPDTAKKIDDSITQSVRELIKDQSLPIEVINITLGRARPNPNVLEQMNLTAAQQQRVKTLTEATRAEEQRKAEQVARAEADNAYRQYMNWTPEQYLQSQLADKTIEACAKAKSCYLVPPNSNITLK